MIIVYLKVKFNILGKCVFSLSCQEEKNQHQFHVCCLLTLKLKQGSDSPSLDLRLEAQGNVKMLKNIKNYLKQQQNCKNNLPPTVKLRKNLGYSL